jgi:hypothetical protein
VKVALEDSQREHASDRLAIIFVDHRGPLFFAICGNACLLPPRCLTTYRAIFVALQFKREGECRVIWYKITVFAFSVLLQITLEAYAKLIKQILGNLALKTGTLIATIDHQSAFARLADVAALAAFSSAQWRKYVERAMPALLAAAIKTLDCSSVSKTRLSCFFM